MSDTLPPVEVEALVARLEVSVPPLTAPAGQLASWIVDAQDALREASSALAGMAEEIARLTSQVKKASEALEPFARAPQDYGNAHATDADLYPACVLTFGDLRRAARVREEIGGEG